MIYQVQSLDEPLSQGDILDACPLLGLPESFPESKPEIWYERVMILTQACDLAQGKGSKVVVALVQSAAALVERGTLKANVVRDQVRRGQVHGWYFLPAAPAPIMLPESIVDMRDLHTLPRTVLEGLVTRGQRVCRLLTPYREHLAQHFAVTYMRIGLPGPYESFP